MENFKQKNISERAGAELGLQTNRDLRQYEILLRITDEDLKDKVILDLGSGPERQFAEDIRREIPSAKVVSLDARLEKEDDKKDAAVVGLFTKLPFADESFDRVVSVAAMPFYLHTREQMDLSFREIARVLRKGGKAFVGPVTYTEIIDTDPDKDIWSTHRQYSYEETKAVLTSVLEAIEGISFEFFPDMYHEPRHTIRGRSKHEPSVLVIQKRS